MRFISVIAVGVAAVLLLIAFGAINTKKGTSASPAPVVGIKKAKGPQFRKQLPGQAVRRQAATVLLRSRGPAVTLRSLKASLVRRPSGAAKVAGLQASDQLPGLARQATAAPALRRAQGASPTFRRLALAVKAARTAGVHKQAVGPQTVYRLRGMAPASTGSLRRGAPEVRARLQLTKTITRLAVSRVRQTQVVLSSLRRGGSALAISGHPLKQAATPAAALDALGHPPREVPVDVHGGGYARMPKDLGNHGHFFSSFKEESRSGVPQVMKSLMR
jgi:hypothetical protein